MPWLTGSPTEFTVAPGASQTVTVTLTARPSAGVLQPGRYTAAFGLLANTPYPIPDVGVEMNVSPPKSWGKVQGTVLGRPCTGGPVPLPATVRINSLSNPSVAVTLRADNQGRYAYWLPSGRYEVIVAREGWVPATARTRVAASAVVTLNFTLDPAVPCPGA